MGLVRSHDKLFIMWVSMNSTKMNTFPCTKSAAVKTVISLHFQYLQFFKQISARKYWLEHYAKSLALQKNMLGLLFEFLFNMNKKDVKIGISMTDEETSKNYLLKSLSFSRRQIGYSYKEGPS